MENLKNKVAALLAKRGNNKQEVQDMINQHFNDAVRCYDNPKASTIANFLQTVY